MKKKVYKISYDDEQNNLESIRMILLKKLANNVALRFYCPIYLVGSYLENKSEALDVDLIMVATEERIVRLFGSKDFNDKWFRFLWKQKKYFEDHLTMFDIDFKIQSLEHFNKMVGKRIKLDTYIEAPR